MAAAAAEEGPVIGVHSSDAAEEGPVIGVHSSDSWMELFQKSKDAKQLVVVDFTASWCGPCRWIAPVFAQIAKEMPNVMCLKVDVDEMKALAEQWQVTGMPTFLFIKEGEEVDRLVGCNKGALQAMVTKHAV